MKNNGLHHQDPKAGDIWQYTENFSLSQLRGDAACIVGQRLGSLRGFLQGTRTCLSKELPAPKYQVSALKLLLQSENSPLNEKQESVTICWCG